MTSPPPPPPPSAEAEKLLKKIKTLEEDHANLREEMSKLVISGEVHGLPPPRYGGGNDELWKAAHGHQFTDKDCLNILECMGQAIHIFCPQGRIFYWNRSAENLYGYSAAEAIGRGVCELIVMSRDFTFAEVIIHRCRMGQSWTGQFPVRHKMGHMLPVIVMNTPFYDDDGTLIGVISLTCDSRPFKDTQVSVSDAEEVEIGQDFSRRQSGVTTRIGLNSDQSLQTVIASKFTNLASKVGSKVRSKMKTGESNVFGESGSGDSHRSDHASVLPDHREDENCSGASTPRGDPAGTPFGIFTSFATGKSPAQAQGNFIDESEGKPGIHKILASKAEVWIGKKAIQWSGKGTERETSEPQSGRFVWPWMQGEQDSNCRHSAVKSEIQTGDYNRPVANEASGSWSSFNGSGTSSASSCGRSSSSAIHKLDVETHSLDYEILWEDLTVGEQIGRDFQERIDDEVRFSEKDDGSCGTVYHGLWYGSDIAIKIFSKQEYSEEVIFSFKQEVSLMNRLRHPNILLFMGAVTSPQRLCIVTEFLPRFILNFPFQRKPVPPAAEEHIETRLETTTSYSFRHSRYSNARGMNYLHNCNPPIVHRDLKSSNLLVDKSWSVKVADFGLSRVKHETYLTTKTGKGTPQWMAPEVLQNERSDEKSDLYSFGVILWELATQKIPWEHLNAMQVIGAVGFMNQRLDIPEDLDPRWASLIESCWRSEPRSRPTFQDLLEELKDMQRQYAVQFQAASAAASADGGLEENFEL